MKAGRAQVAFFYEFTGNPSAAPGFDTGGRGI